MPEELPAGRDIRFCPYCFQQTFEVSKDMREWVYCEMCGIDVEIKDLVKQ